MSPILKRHQAKLKGKYMNTQHRATVTQISTQLTKA
jgi:hypothetical protein